MLKKKIYMWCLSSKYTKIGTIQRKLAWHPVQGCHEVFHSY